MTEKCETGIRLLFAGDVAPVQPEELEWAQSQPQALFGAIQGEIKASDAFIVNLECPLTQSHCQLPKYGPHLQSSAAVAEILAQMGVTAVSLANNHMLDYGQQGGLRHNECLGEKPTLLLWRWADGEVGLRAPFP